MTVGSLLQYKEQFYGRYYPRLPTLPFSTEHALMVSTHTGSFNEYKLQQAGFPVALKESGRKKFVLFCAKVVRVPHPKIDLIACNYFKCLISDPYTNGETIDGWVKEEWVEPLNEFGTYREEQIMSVREAYLALNAKKSQVQK